MIDTKEEFIENGAQFSLMSGSGSSVFGLFEDKISAEQCYENMMKTNKSLFLTKFLNDLEENMA